MKTFAAVLLFVFPLLAADPSGFNLWTSAELKGFDKKLAGKKVATETLTRYGNHYTMVAHREADGEAEFHETDADLFVIESGSGTLIVGGEMVDAKRTAEHEMRAPSIKNGTSHHVSAGDIVHIPAKTPHQFMVPSGKVTYFVMKVTE